MMQTSGEVTNLFSKELFVASRSWTCLVASDSAFSRCSHLLEKKKLVPNGAEKKQTHQIQLKMHLFVRVWLAFSTS